MNECRLLLPQDARIDGAEALRRVATARRVALAPASQEAKEFCAALSTRLLNDPRCRPFPTLQALGYWLRPAALERMIATHLAETSAQRPMPCGTVFAITPGTIETLFAYLAAIALLCGDAIVVRLSRQEGAASALLIALFADCLAEAPQALRDRVILLSYGHDDAMTGALSLACDTRLVWGGDETVRHIGALPLPPAARNFGFGDRFSLAALNAARYAALDAAERDKLAQQFFNDVYLFDQLACAAPRLLYWIGEEAEAAQVETDFYRRVNAVAEARGYRPALAENLAKLNARFLALHDLDVADCAVFGPALTVLRLRSLRHVAAFKSVNWGYGLLLAACLPDLAAIAAHNDPCDQTLSCWGFAPEAISALAQSLPDKGLGRIVPTGQALTFDAVWDGVNLFDAMTRRERAAP